MKKPTIRKNGELMFTLTVQFSVGLDDIASMLQHECAKYPNTRKEAWKIIRQYLAWYGPPDCGRWDDVSENDREIALEKTRQLFPELY